MSIRSISQLCMVFVNGIKIVSICANISSPTALFMSCIHSCCPYHLRGRINTRSLMFVYLQSSCLTCSNCSAWCLNNVPCRRMSSHWPSLSRAHCETGPPLHSGTPLAHAFDRPRPTPNSSHNSWSRCCGTRVVTCQLCSVWCSPMCYTTWRPCSLRTRWCILFFTSIRLHWSDCFAFVGIYACDNIPIRVTSMPWLINLLSGVSSFQISFN